MAFSSYSSSVSASDADFTRLILKRLYFGDSGGQFALFSSVMPSGTDFCLFPQLLATLRSKKEDLRTLLPLTTNYVQAITSLITGSVLDSGRIPFVLEEKTNFFTDFWKKEKADALCSQILVHSLVSGFAGVRFGRKNKHLTLLSFGFEDIAVFSDEKIVFSYVLPSNDADVDKNIKYEVTYQQTEAGWTAQHQAYRFLQGKWAEKACTDTLQKCFPQSVFAENGFEPQLYHYCPVLRFESHVYGIDNKPMGVFASVLDKIQVLWFYDMLKVLDQQAHFLSKMALPQRFFQTDPITGETLDLASLSFLPIDENNAVPQYIKKDIKDSHEMMSLHRRELLVDMALSLSIPPDFLTKDSLTVNQRVEAIKMNKLPFDRLVRRYQAKLEVFFSAILDHVCFDGQKERPEVTFTWKGGLDV